MATTWTKTELALMEASVDLDISECNSSWFHGLARLIDESGKELNDLTVGELRALIRQRTADFNRIHGMPRLRENNK